MIAVIFEVEPAQGDPKPYLDIAATLIDELKAIDGFISVERFQSLSTPGKLLSLSFWRDEDACALALAGIAPRASRRRGVFQDYRLRVAQVLRDYGMARRDEARATAASGTAEAARQAR